jgi:hypothetical protein
MQAVLSRRGIEESGFAMLTTKITLIKVKSHGAATSHSWLTGIRKQAATSHSWLTGIRKHLQAFTRICKCSHTHHYLKEAQINGKLPAVGQNYLH